MPPAQPASTRPDLWAAAGDSVHFSCKPAVVNVCKVAVDVYSNGQQDEASGGQFQEGSEVWEKNLKNLSQIETVTPCMS